MLDERMALASIDLLSSIIISWSAGLGRLDALSMIAPAGLDWRPIRSRSNMQTIDRAAVMLLAGGWGPHGNSGVGVSNHLESRRLQPLNSFRNGL